MNTSSKYDFIKKVNGTGNKNPGLREGKGVDDGKFGKSTLRECDPTGTIFALLFREPILFQGQFNTLFSHNMDPLVNHSLPQSAVECLHYTKHWSDNHTHP